MHSILSFKVNHLSVKEHSEPPNKTAKGQSTTLEAMYDESSANGETRAQQKQAQERKAINEALRQINEEESCSQMWLLQSTRPHRNQMSHA